MLLNVANLYNSTAGGMPQDTTEGLRWYRLAADKGNEEALFIGIMYEIGNGVNQDLSEAMAVMNWRLKGETPAQIQHRHYVHTQPRRFAVQGVEIGSSGPI